MRRNFTRILLLSIALWANSVTSFAQISLPFTMTESLFNSSDVDKNLSKSDYRHLWENGQIRMYATGALAAGCGVCSNDHYFTVHIAGVPDRISFTTSASGAATATVGWTLEESADGSNWSRVWRQNARNCEVDAELSKTTRYVRLHENFNYSGYVKDFAVTACHYVKLVVDEDTVYVSNPLRQGESYGLTAPDVLSSGCRSFAGWSQSLSGTMGDRDVVIYAQYEIPTYTATLHLSDSVQSIDLKDEALQAKCGQSIQVKNPTVKGFTFKGWNPAIPSIASSEMEGKTYVAQWSRNFYQLRCVVASDTQRYEVGYDEALPSIADPKKMGCQFKNWEPALPEKMPAEDLTVVAQFQKEQYSLKIHDEDSLYVDSLLTFEEPLLLTQPEKRGYTLLNWSDVPANMPAEAVDVALNWSANPYTLTLQVAGDTLYAATLHFGDSIAYPAMPDSLHYLLVWNQAFPALMPDSDMVLTGVWEKREFAFLAMDGADTLSLKYYQTGDLIDPVVVTDREGFTFDGWSPEVPLAMADADIVTYAQWVRNSYPFYLVSTEDTLVAKYIGYGDSLTLPAVADRIGYTFVMEDSIPAVMPADTVTLHGSWRVNQYSFVLKDGEKVLVDTIIAYNSALKFTDPTREGALFEGWDPAIPATMPAGDFEAKALWRGELHWLTTLVEGDTLSHQQYAFGDSVQIPAVAERVGYSFSWKDSFPTFMPSVDVVVKGAYQANDYPFVAMVDQDTLLDVVYHYGDTLPSLKEPTKAGYRFEGWLPTLPSTMPAEKFVTKAQWSRESYWLTALADGDTLSHQQYAFGDSIQIPAVAERIGYSFSWKDSFPTFMPSADVVVKGAYVVNDYRFIVVVDGDTVKNVVYPYGSDVERMDAPEKPGYAFEGWSEDWPTTMPAKDLALTAVWNTSLFAYKVMDGETALVDTLYAFGAPVAPLSKLTKEGHSFVGWDTTYAIMPAHDVEINAQWNRLEYTITLMMVSAVNNAMLGKPQKITLPYGAEIESEIEKPQFDGYEYDGWKNDCPTTMPAKGFALIALMKPLQTVGCEDLQNGPLTVRVLDRTIYLENYDGGENVRLYDLLGNLLYEGRERSFSVKKTGLYVVQTPERSVKVVVK